MKKLIKVLFLSFAFIYILTVNSVYAQKNLGFKKEQIDSVNELEVFADNFFKEKQTNIASTLIVIFKDNKTFFKSYPEHSKSFSELTQFDSRVFKEIFIFIGILNLYEQEKLNLRGDISNYKLKYDRNFKQNILVENVLTHTTGIQENIIYPDFEKQRSSDYWSFKPSYRYSEPNELIGYSDDNLWILEYILKEVSEKNPDEFITNSILSKLDLGNTNLKNSKLWTNGKDIERIIPTFLNPEEVTSKLLLKSDTWREIFQEKIRLEDKLPGSVTGFFEHYENKVWGYSKLYFSNSTTEEFIFFPEKKSGVYIFTGSYNPSLRRDFVASFLDQFFPVEKKKIKRDKSPGYSEYLKNFEGEYSAVQISSHSFSKFRMYNSVIKVLQENGMLILQSGKMEPYGDLDGRLEFIETDPFLFRSPDRETYISFKMNEAGDVEYLLSGSGQHGVYKKLTLSESTLFQENLCLFFISFYLIFFILLVVEIPYIFAKKIAYTPNRIRQTIQILLWLENVIVFSIFGSFYYFVDSYRLMESYDYIIEGNPYDYTIFTLPFVFIFGVSLLTYYTLRGVLDKQLHLYRLIQLGLFLFVSLGFVYWLSYWNLIGYGF
ncbi:MAG: serine hydrolase [Leptospiraceae bacterium]|nr:serine hydrolase [Leptospiraceae bacterium]